MLTTLLLRRSLPSVQRTYIRSVLMYAVLVFYQALPLYLKYEIERVQKRALSIIYPGILYSDALSRWYMVQHLLIKKCCSWHECVMPCWMLKNAIQHVQRCWTMLNENRDQLYSFQHVCATWFNICWATNVAGCWTVCHRLKSMQISLRSILIVKPFAERHFSIINDKENCTSP